METSTGITASSQDIPHAGTSRPRSQMDRYSSGPVSR